MLSLLTASSFAPFSTSARMTSTPADRDGLVQQRRAVRRLRVGIGAGLQQHLERLDGLAVRRLAERRRTETIESRDRRQTTRRVRRSWTIIAAVLPTLPLAPRPAAAPAGLRRRARLLHLRRTPVDFRAVRQHQLQRFDVGRDRRAIERRAVQLRGRSTASVEWIWPTNGLFGSAPLSSSRLIRSIDVSLFGMIRRAASSRRGRACRSSRRACRRRSRANRRSHRHRGRAAVPARSNRSLTIATIDGRQAVAVGRASDRRRP